MVQVSHETASSSTECSRDKPPFSFVRGQDSEMWDKHYTVVTDVISHLFCDLPVGWVGGWVGGWMDGWMDGCQY